MDACGNTFLHLAMQEDFSEQSHEAVKYLISKDLLDDNLNDDEKMAADYLTRSNDKRAEALMDFFITRMEKMREEFQAAPAKEYGWLEEKAFEEKDALQEKELRDLRASQENTHNMSDTKRTGCEPSEQDCLGSDEAAQVSPNKNSMKVIKKGS